MGPVLGPHAHTHRARDTRVADLLPPASEGERPGEGQRLTADAPRRGGRPALPGDGPRHPRGTQPPQGIQAKGIVLGRSPHTRAHGTVVADPDSLSRGRAAGGGGAPELGRPSQRRKGPPPGGRPSPPPQRGTTVRKGARCGTGAASPRPHQPHPGHTGCGTPAARPRGRAARGGTAPDARWA